MSREPSFSEKLAAVRRVASHRPLFTAGITVLSVGAALFEGIGLGFLIPIVEQARGSGELGGFSRAFFRVYEFFGVPFTLEYILVGVTLVMTARYSMTFAVAWLRERLRMSYVRELQVRTYDSALSARVSYFDEVGSDEILNTIVTQARKAGNVIVRLVQIVEQSVISLMYFSVALFLAPRLTLFAGVVLGTLTYVVRVRFEAGYAVGDRFAEANERLQESAQAGTQGVRDVKLFGLSDGLFDDFTQYADKIKRSRVRLRRNQEAIHNLYQLTTALTVFGLIYLALRLTTLSLGEVGVFLFAMFRLSPRISNLNNWIYQVDGQLPHLIRTEESIDAMTANAEPSGRRDEGPASVDHVECDSVSFAYDDDRVLSGVSFEVSRGELVAFVGPSGAGKSTVISLLTRLYDPDDGEIRADGTPITEYPPREWRRRLSVVRQDPFIFNETLEHNVRVADETATEAEVRRVCEIAQVDEFVTDLPDGYDSTLGDDGVRLSGGQRQRVALARALLKDSDLLLLDEATSDLDRNIERTVQRGIESLNDDRGVVVVAHRLSTVKNADRIYTMEDGEVVEVGSHEELLTSDGTYAELYTTDTAVES